MTLSLFFEWRDMPFVKKDAVLTLKLEQMWLVNFETISIHW